VFDHGEDQVLRPVVPVLAQLLPEVQFPRLCGDHGVVDLAREDNSGGPAGELFEGDAELELGVFEESVADEEDAVPGLVGRGVLSSVSSCGMM
jgi:hypothetical protein